MGFSSQAGHVVLRTQPTPGTFAADIATAGIAVPTRGGALASSRELLVPDPEIGGGRDVLNAYLGANAYSGDYEFYARINGLVTFLGACLGTSASAVATGVTTYTITPSDAPQLPFLSIQERIGNGLETFNYTDAVINTLHLECDANGYLSGTVGVIARLQTAGATPIDVTTLWDATPMMVGTNVSLTYNGVTLPAKSFSLDINNNFEDDDFRLGSFQLGDLTPKRREVTVGFRIRENSSALWRQATNGVSSAVAPGGLVTKQSLVLNFSAYENIPGSTPATPYGGTFTFPYFVLTPYTLAVSGDDIIESDLEGRALKPVAATPIMTAALRTDLAAAA